MEQKSSALPASPQIKLPLELVQWHSYRASTFVPWTDYTMT